MAYNLAQEKLINQLVNDVSELKQFMQQIRTNQTNVLKFGNITLNGAAGTITIGDSNFVIDGVNKKITASQSGTPVDIIDSYGLISNSTVTSTSGSTSTGLNQQFSSGGGTGTVGDITGMSFTINPFRTVRLYVWGQVLGWVYNAGAGDFSGRGLSYIYFDGGEVTRTVESGGTIGTDSHGGEFFSVMMHYFGTPGAGSHTVKLRASCDASVGTPGFNVYEARLSYLIIGN